MVVFFFGEKNPAWGGRKIFSIFWRFLFFGVVLVAVVWVVAAQDVLDFGQRVFELVDDAVDVARELVDLFVGRVREAVDFRREVFFDFLQAGEFLVELGLEVGLDARFFGLEFLDFCGEFVEDGLRFVFELGDFLVHFGRSESKICDSFDPIFSNSAVKDSGLTVEKFIR